MPTLTAENAFYCVRCRDHVRADKDTMCVTVYNNKRSGKTPALRAKCPTCSTNLTKFIARDKQAELTEKYGKC